MDYDYDYDHDYMYDEYDSSSEQTTNLRGGSLEGTFFPRSTPPSKPFPTFADNWEKNHKVPLTITLPRGARLGNPFNPDPATYQTAERDAARSGKIRCLGFDDSYLLPVEREGDDVTGFGPLRGDRNLGSLRGRPWKPTRLELTMKWPLGQELGSDWYRLIFVHLHLRTWGMAEKYFGYGDIDLTTAPGRSLWTQAGLGKAFVHYAQLVARQDNVTGGWETLLASQAHRKCLVTGVVAKALQTEVFDEYLFGANEVTKQMFASQDKATITNEGYSRSNVRSESVRLVLGRKTLPDGFWGRVDQLAYQLTDMLLPLLKLMDKNFADSRLQSIRSVHQDLHHIVSEAGFMSIGIRWSRNVFRFTWPTPGQPWELDQENVDESIFRRSKEANFKLDKIAEEEWEKKQAIKRPTAKPTRNQFKHIRDRLRNNRTAHEPPHSCYATGPENPAVGTEAGGSGNGEATAPYAPPSYLAKVHITLCPTFERFTTASGDGESQDVLVASGEAIEPIQKSRVVYYLGQADDRNDGLESEPPLEKWVGVQKWGKAWAIARLSSSPNFATFVERALLIAIALAAIWCLVRLSLDGHGFAGMVARFLHGLVRFCFIYWIGLVIDSIRLVIGVVKGVYWAALLVANVGSCIISGGRLGQCPPRTTGGFERAGYEGAD